MAPTPTGTAFCMAWPRVRSKPRRIADREGCRPRPARNIRRANGRRRMRHRVRDRDPASASSTRRVAMRDRHQRRLGILGELQGLRRTVPDDRGQLFAERGIHLVEHRPGGRKGLRQRLAHADGLDPWPGKVNAAVIGAPRTFRNPGQDSRPKDTAGDQYVKPKQVPERETGDFGPGFPLPSGPKILITRAIRWSRPGAERTVSAISPVWRC